ncbi:MAG: hypothetical protein WC332_00880 [Clostridia bacterium]|jgi:hypothetical protein
MAIDYSEISTEDLEALQNKQYDKVSTSTLEYLQSGVKPKKPTEETTTVTKPVEEGFVSDLVTAGKRRIENISNPQPSAVREFNPALGAGLNVAGQVGGFVGDVVSTGLRSAYKAMPKSAQENISGIGKMIATNPVVDAAKTAYGELPEDVKNDLGNIANASMIMPAAKTLSAFKKFGGKAAEETGAVVADAMEMVNRKIQPVTKSVVDREINQIVKDNLNKSIKATSKGKQTLPLIEKYFTDAGTGIKEIINNKQGLNLTNDVGEIVNGALPETRLQMSQAIHSTEKKLFTEYDTMQKAATGKGARLDLEPIAKQYDDVINNETLRATKEGRAVIKHAEEAQTILREIKTMSPEAAQDFIAQANNKLLNKNLMPLDVSKASADAGIASIMRKELDKLIESTEGAGYQDIKRRYGSVKSLREGTNKATFAAFAEKGTPNFFDITSGTALVHGLLTLNPATIAGGGFMEALNILRRNLKNPDTYVKKMFSDVDSIMTKGTEFQPASKTGQYIKGKFTQAPPEYPFSDASGAIPTPLGLPMPERGFTLKGEPTGEVLRPLRTKPQPSDVIDAEFTSIPRLTGNRPPEPSQIPWQDFSTQEIIPRVGNAKLERLYGDLNEEQYLKGLRNARRRSQ